MNNRDNELLELTENIKELACEYGCRSRVIDNLNDTKNNISRGNYNIRAVTGTLYEVLDHIESLHPELSHENVTASLNEKQRLQDIISECQRNLSNLQLKTENGVAEISSHTARDFDNMITNRFDGEDFIKSNIIIANMDRLIENHKTDLTKYKKSIVEDNLSQYDHAIKRAINNNLISEKTAYSKWDSQRDSIKTGIEERVAPLATGAEVLTYYKNSVQKDTATITRKEKIKKNLKLLIPFFVIILLFILVVTVTLIIAGRMNKNRSDLPVEQTVEQTSPTFMDHIDNLDHTVKTLDKAGKFVMSSSVQLFLKQMAIVILLFFSLIVGLYLAFFIYQNLTLKRKIYKKIQKNAKRNLSVVLGERRIENLDRQCIANANVIIRNELEAIQNEVFSDILEDSNNLSESPTRKYRKQLDNFLI